MPNKKILICDDDEGILDVLELMLADISHEIICELNSLNVPMLIEREQPDLVILDLWMPVVSGDQLLRAIRANPVTKHLPVMIISASRDGQEIAVAAGASAYMAKPFDMDNLLDTVESFLD